MDKKALKIYVALAILVFCIPGICGAKLFWLPPGIFPVPLPVWIPGW